MDFIPYASSLAFAGAFQDFVDIESTVWLCCEGVEGVLGVENAGTQPYEVESLSAQMARVVSKKSR
jgi:hypothetical protein